MTLREDGYVNVHPIKLAVWQMETCCCALARAEAAEFEVLNAVTAAHRALQAALIASLAGTAGVGAFDDKLAAKHLEWLANTPIEPANEPSWRVMEYRALLEAAQTERLTLHFGGEPLSFDGEEKMLLARLGSIRDALEHPKPMVAGFEVRYLLEPLPLAMSVVLTLLSHPAINHQVKPDLRKRAAQAQKDVIEMVERILV